MEIGKEIKSRFKSPQQKAIINVRFTSNWISNLQNGFMSKFDLTMPQFNILRILRGANEAINVNTVKERMIEKSPNTTRLMDKLIEKGLINRIRCEKDRRVVYVEISSKGQEILTEIDHSVDNNSFFTEKLNDQEAETLSNLLDKLRD
jgi:MarR family 2-MHQ and catechol resistance regulon transcriptional repressor